MSAPAVGLEVLGITRRFDHQAAVDDVSFTLAAGEVLALLGPSGSGKSTLLSLIAGLEAPDSGDVRWDGRSLLDVPTHQRGFGLMFQDYALFPHKDVAGNVGFGLRMQNQPPAEVAAGTRWALELVGLADFGRRDVNTLSGGEQQRVALARALAPRPRLLMLDEPMGALDRALRERLLDELGGILRRLRQTAIYVTHDQDEALALADRVIILRAGRVAQAGPPAEIYARPASRFVAEFLGLHNILPAMVARQSSGAVAATELGDIPLPSGPWANGTAVQVLVHPDGLRLAADGEAGPGLLTGRVTEKAFRGSRSRVTLAAGGQTLTVDLPAAQPLPALGEPLHLRVEPSAVHVLPPKGELLDE
ncbi:MAG: ABC transporter ATP-binding protein [Anaerolineales bacterium]